MTYDSGDYPQALDAALTLADYAGFAGPQGRERQARQAARHRHLHLHRGLRHRAVGRGRLAGRRRRPVGIGQDPVQPDRQRHRPHRQPQPRPGPRDDLRPARLELSRHAGRPGRGRPWRHRQDAVRHGHLRLALAGGRRLRHRQGGGQDHRQGQEDRRPPAGGGRGRHRVQGRQVHRRRHRQGQDDPGGRLGRLCAAQLSRGTSSRGWRRRAFYDPINFTFPAGTQICEVEIDPDTGVVDHRQLHGGR